MKAWFDYEKLEREGGGVSPSGRHVVLCDNSFNRVKSLAQETPDTGWKLHVSVDGKSVPDVWNLLAPYLMENGVESFKVARQNLVEKFDRPENRQAGKMLTVYLHEGQDDPRRLAEGIEHLLKASGIMPGPQVAGDKAIAGSGYLHYRNDKGPAGDYLSADEAGALAETADLVAFNPCGKPDPFEGFRMGAEDAPLSEDVRMVSASTILSSVLGHSVTKKGNDFPAVLAVAEFVLGGPPDVEGLDVVKGELSRQIPQLQDLRPGEENAWLARHGLSMKDEFAVSALPAGEVVRLREKLRKEKAAHIQATGRENNAKIIHKLQGG